MSPAPPNLPWHPIPSATATCKVHLLQAGGLRIPLDMTLLPGPNKPNFSNDSGENHTDEHGPKTFFAPDYVFVISHTPTGNTYMFDLGMRTDLDQLPPTLIDNILPQFKCSPKSVTSLLKEHGTPGQQPESIKAVIFSHMHFDHVGAGTQPDFPNAEVWIGPTTCTYARPGYPVDPKAPTLSATLPVDASVKIVESFVSDEELREAGDKREGMVQEGLLKGKYQAVDLKKQTWKELGSFDRAYDVFGDGSAYLLDSPGHSAGHQMMLVRTTSGSATFTGPPDNDPDASDSTFVLLAGDGYHHPDLLQDPWRTARPPYSKESMHKDPEVSIETIWRMRAFAEKENVWVIGAHDFSIGKNICGKEEELIGLVDINDWQEKGWKNPIHRA